MKKQLKRLVVLAVAATMFLSSAFGVSAAGLRDVFDAKHYADTYKDLKAAFGDNEEALYQHFINYGLKENRQMSPIIDVQAYRKAYPDLEAAFGNNWDAYVEHFFMFGAKENRTGGVLFNPFKYAEAYPDVKAAFGSNLKAITKHFLVFGIKEGRTAGIVAKEQPASSGGSGGGASSAGPAPSNTQPGPKAPTALEPPAAGALKDGASADVGTINSGDKTVSATIADDITTGGFQTQLATVSTGDIVCLKANVAAASAPDTVDITVSGSVVAALQAAKNKATVSGGNVAVQVDSKVANVVIPYAALEQAGGNASTPVTIAIASVTDNNSIPKKDVYGETVSTNNMVVVDVKLKVGTQEKPISGLRDTDKIQITVDAPANVQSNGDYVFVYYVKDGRLEPVGRATVASGKVSFAVDHLTRFVFTDKGHEIADGAHTADMYPDEATKCILCGLAKETWQAAHTHVFDKTAETKGNCKVCGATDACPNKTGSEEGKHGVLKIDEYCAVCGVQGGVKYAAADCPDSTKHASLPGNCPKCDYTKPAGGSNPPGTEDPVTPAEAVEVTHTVSEEVADGAITIAVTGNKRTNDESYAITVSDSNPYSTATSIQLTVAEEAVAALSGNNITLTSKLADVTIESTEIQKVAAGAAMTLTITKVTDELTVSGGSPTLVTGVVVFKVEKDVSSSVDVAVTPPDNKDSANSLKVYKGTIDGSKNVTLEALDPQPQEENSKVKITVTENDVTYIVNKEVPSAG